MPTGVPPSLSTLLTASDTSDVERAWGEFVSGHSSLLLYAIRRRGGSHDAVMDRYAFVLEQLRADDFRRLRGWVNDGRSQFGTWLVVVVTRLCHDHHRKHFGRAREAGAEELGVRERRRRLADLVVEELDPNLTPAEVDDPTLAVRQSELLANLAASVERLTSEDQFLLTLRFRDNLPASDIARILGVPTPFHVYRRLNSLLDGLRQALRARGVEGPEP